jgi:predicted site-specific integrase-resolvase
MEASNIKKDWLNPIEVNKEYGLSRSTLAKWRMDKIHLKFSKIGKYIKYKREDIEDFLNKNLVQVQI